jgi:hypothetical protein
MPSFGHYLYGFRVNAMRFYSGTANIRLIAAKVSQVTFCYLAAATVAGA